MCQQSGSIDLIAGAEPERSDSSRPTVAPAAAGAMNGSPQSYHTSADGAASGVAHNAANGLVIGDAVKAVSRLWGEGKKSARHFRRHSTGEDFEASAGPRGKDGYGDANDTRHVGVGSHWYDPREDVVLRIECATDAQTRVRRHMVTRAATHFHACLPRSLFELCFPLLSGSPWLICTPVICKEGSCRSAINVLRRQRSCLRGCASTWERSFWWSRSCSSSANPTGALRWPAYCANRQRIPQPRFAVAFRGLRHSVLPCRNGTHECSLSAKTVLLRRWFLTSNAIFVMHFIVALLCTLGLWAMLVVFSLRLRQALTSGKAWSRRRRSGCIYAYTLSIIQVRQRGAVR